MPRQTNKEMLAQRQDASAPFLFDENELPVCESVLESVRQERYAHKGVRLLEDDAKALRLVELLLNGWGVKRISEEMHISKHTVRAARRALAEQGKLAPYKQRIVEGIEDAVLAGIEKYRDALEGGFIPPAQIPVGVGILFDKRALMMGEPTQITGKAALDESLSEDRLNAFLDALPRANATVLPASADSESNANPVKGQ